MDLKQSKQFSHFKSKIEFHNIDQLTIYFTNDELIGLVTEYEKWLITKQKCNLIMKLSSISSKDDDKSVADFLSHIYTVLFISLDLKYKDKEGRSCLYYLYKSQLFQSAEFLIGNYLLDPNISNNNGITLLEEIILNCFSVAVFRFISLNQVDVNVLNSDGHNALNLFTDSKSLKITDSEVNILRLLLKKNIKTKTERFDYKELSMGNNELSLLLSSNEELSLCTFPLSQNELNEYKVNLRKCVIKDNGSFLSTDKLSLQNKRPSFIEIIKRIRDYHSLVKLQIALSECNLPDEKVFSILKNKISQSDYYFEMKESN